MADRGPFYEYPAWIQMESVLEAYEQEREEYLAQKAESLGPDGKDQLAAFNRAADVLISGLENLHGVDILVSLPELSKLGNFGEHEAFSLLDEHACMRFAWEAMGMLSSARERFVSLIVAVGERNPCAAAKAFLQRVSRCYLFGFDSECVIMCRAVLDREFDDSIINDDQVSEWWEDYKHSPEGRRYRGQQPPYRELRAKIAAARYCGMLNDTEYEAANEVRNRGNDAVHKKPDTGEPLRAIMQTVLVLDALERSRGGRTH